MRVVFYLGFFNPFIGLKTLYLGLSMAAMMRSLRASSASRLFSKPTKDFALTSRMLVRRLKASGDDRGSSFFGCGF